MLRIVKNTVVALLILLGNSGFVAAKEFAFSDYFPVHESHETWNYSGAHEFSLTLTKIIDGPYTGLRKFGNTQNAIIFSAKKGVVRWYVYNNRPLNPVIEFSPRYKTNTVYRIDNKEVVFVAIDELSVEAGAFKDVIAMVWLNDGYFANRMNDELGIDIKLTASAVSDIDYYARGVGLLGYQAVHARSGAVIGMYMLSSIGPAEGLGAASNRVHFSQVAE